MIREYDSTLMTTTIFVLEREPARHSAKRKRSDDEIQEPNKDSPEIPPKVSGKL